ncbi:hypothetical protein Tco_1138722 [Tanacetum coccineum]
MVDQYRYILNGRYQDDCEEEGLEPLLTSSSCCETFLPIHSSLRFVIRAPTHGTPFDASSDSSLRHSLSDHSLPDLPSTSAGPSRKRRRSPMTSVPALSPVSGALSHVRADLIPSPKRVKDSGYLEDVLERLV